MFSFSNIGKNAAHGTVFFSSKRRPALAAVALGVAVLAMASLPAHATDFYVSNHADGDPGIPLGNDSNAGTSPTQAWRTLAKLRTRQFQAGDNVFLRCGGLWREKLVFDHNNVAATPLKIGSFGDNCATNRPVINGANRLSPAKWVPSATYPGVYEYTDPLPAPLQLIANGVPMKVARYPADGFLSLAANATTPYSHLLISAADSAALLARAGAGGAVGADANIRTDLWIVETRPVDTYTDITPGAGADLGLSGSNLSYAAREKFGFYLSNKAWMLGAPGQWFYAPSSPAGSGKLYFRPPAATPDMATLTVESSQRTDGVIVHGLVDVEVAGLTVVNASSCGICLFDSSRSIVRDSLVLAAGDTGIGLVTGGTAWPRDQVQILNNEVRHSQKYGIWVREATNTVVDGNLVEDTGMATGPLGRPHGMNVGSDTAVVTRNTVRRSAYNGITFTNHSATVQHNLVEDSCQLFGDCGAFYTGGANLPVEARSTVADNLVLRVASSRAGTPSAGQDSRVLAMGIYLDDFSGNVSVLRNSVFDTEFGMMMHQATGTVAENNAFLKVKDACFLLGAAQGNNSYRNNDCLIGGQVFGPARILTSSTAKPLRAGSGVRLLTPKTYAESLQENVFSGNSYHALYGPVRFTVEINATASINGQDFSMAQWRTFHGGNEALNTPQLFGLRLFKPVGAGANVIPNGTFATPWTVSPATDSSTVLNTAECGNAPCGQVMFSSDGSYLASSLVSLQADKSYVLSFDLRSPDSAQIDANWKVPVNLRQRPSYNAGGYYQYEAVGPEWSRFSTPFITTGNAGAQANELVFYGAKNLAGRRLLVDNVSLVPVESIDYNPTSADVLELANASDTARSFDCPVERVVSCAGYAYPDGSPVVWPVAVAPWKMAALVWKNSPFATTP